MFRTVGKWLGRAVVLVLVNGTAAAAPQDFRFEAVSPSVKAGKATIVIQIVQVRTGKPVTDAVIVQNKVEMIMVGMAPMPAKTTPAQVDAAGRYQFTAELPMTGEWQVTRAAKVQGEPETVRGTVKIKARP